MAPLVNACHVDMKTWVQTQTAIKKLGVVVCAVTPVLSSAETGWSVDLVIQPADSEGCSEDWVQWETSPQKVKCGVIGEDTQSWPLASK